MNKLTAEAKAYYDEILLERALPNLLNLRLSPLRRTINTEPESDGTQELIELAELASQQEESAA